MTLGFSYRACTAYKVHHDPGVCYKTCAGYRGQGAAWGTCQGLSIGGREVRLMFFRALSMGTLSTAATVHLPVTKGSEHEQPFNGQILLLPKAVLSLCSPSMGRQGPGIKQRVSMSSLSMGTFDHVIRQFMGIGNSVDGHTVHCCHRPPASHKRQLVSMSSLSMGRLDHSIRHGHRHTQVCNVHTADCCHCPPASHKR